MGLLDFQNTPAGRAEMRATPRRGILGALADAVNGADGLAQKAKVTGLLSELVGLPDIGKTLDRMSYGEPLTTGRGQTLQMRPETVGAALSVAPAVAKYPKAAAGLFDLAVSGGAASGGSSLAQGLAGTLKRGAMDAPIFEKLISSQRFIDRDIVARKIKDKDFTVSITPEFEINGDKVHAITDGHHALQAAIRSGNQPNFIVDTVQKNDRIGLLRGGSPDDYLEAAYHDSPWRHYKHDYELF